MSESANHILLGVCGSVASYRAADLARSLMRSGAEVRVCLTQSAAKFVSPQLFEALTGNPVLVDVFDEPTPGRMAHIDWARWADLVLFAPATASTIAKLAHGVADNMLTTIAAATAAPVVIAPAMNPQMYASESNTKAIKLLSERGAMIVEPLDGDVACGEKGQGKLADGARICDEALAVLHSRKILNGKHLLLTSGPTQEPIDSVRFLSNRSSGKMGAAIARAALLLGASVTVVAGPSSVVYPLGAKTRRVTTAEEMLQAAIEEAPVADWIIGIAAVSDFRPAKPYLGKLRRTQQPLSLELMENPDIISTLANRFPRARTIAFAAEPSPDLERVRQKIVEKGVSAIAANDISDPKIGFTSDENELNLVLADGSVHKGPRASKLACALWLLKTLASSIHNPGVPGIHP
jgi:phosphopantothenoylcysteine decarboxylase/phosphopantothenate--cysteine ligase